MQSENSQAKKFNHTPTPSAYYINVLYGHEKRYTRRKQSQPWLGADCGTFFNMEIASMTRGTKIAHFVSFLLIVSAFALPAIGQTVQAGKKAVSADWPRWRGVNLDNISSQTGWSVDWPAGGPKVLWRASVGAGYSAVSISQGRAYTMGNTDATDSIYCFDTATGKEIWKHSYPCPAFDHPGSRATPTIAGDKVYTVSGQGDIFCLDAEKGTVIWSKKAIKEFGVKPPTWGFSCSPLVAEGLVVVDLGPLIAMKADTGELAWKCGEAVSAYSSPICIQQAGQSRVVAFNGAGLLIASMDGKKMAEFPYRETNCGVNAVTPIVSDDKCFLAYGYKGGSILLDISKPAPTVVWQSKVMRNHFNTCVLYKGYLYGFDGQTGNSGQLKCVEFATGTEKWAQKGMGTGTLMLADGKLIIQGEKGDIVIADASPEGFKQLAKAKVLDGICWTNPVLCDGKIYCRNDKGDLLCLDVSGK
jgi:outer membrane protein assembly factor BamB